MISYTRACLRSFLLQVMLLLFSQNIFSADITVSGIITDVSGNMVPNAKVSFSAGNTDYSTISGTDGSYALKISGIYTGIQGLLEQGKPYPNPFNGSVYIPFIINSSGDIRFSVYTLNGVRIRDVSFPSVAAGSYRILWDGCSSNGAPVRQGLYMYAITFRGKTWSGRLVRATGSPSGSSVTALEPVMMPPVPTQSSDIIKIPVITSVSNINYYSVRLTDIVLRQDTVINFELSMIRPLPFKTDLGQIAMYTITGYRHLNLIGINLGSSPPGYFPGEIAYAIPGELYEKWISQIAEAGFNSIRIYTLHPPVFYEKLANFNYRNPESQLFLFQGIWLGEVENPWDPDEYDLTLRESVFRNDIKEIIDCVHGEKSIPFRPGRSYGDYLTDVSEWTAGYIIGREISPQELDSTNVFHPSMTSYNGNQFSISSASASETFVTKMLDETVSYEYQKYSVKRPVSISSWPTLDPLDHPTEIHTDEDKASYDITKINGKNTDAGLFATYHAYPYYPNFVSDQPSYRDFSDEEGPNSYLGYLVDLKDHYGDTPLVIGEFGVPSSWGSAHQSFSNMDHGGYSEKQQGEKNLRMMHNILYAGCAGGFMFSWMDEWFKPTWIVSHLEAYGFESEDAFISTRQLWHNLTSPEQNFGLITFEQEETLPFTAYQADYMPGMINKIEATHDNSYFYLDIEAKQTLVEGDTLMIAFDTYSVARGESKLPNGKTLDNRSEFLLFLVAGRDTALYSVTQAYDMNGLTPRFNLSDSLVQKYKSTVTDGAPWVTMQWINDGFELTKHDIGRLPAENSSGFSAGERNAMAWNGNKVKVRIPWTMLYFRDPTRMHVLDGATSDDGGYNFVIETTESDGIALSVYYKGDVTSTTSRYSWEKWLIVPPVIAVEKGSYQVVRSGLDAFSRFTD